MTVFIISVRSKKIRIVAVAVLVFVFVTIGGVYFVSHRSAVPAMAPSGERIEAQSKAQRLAILSEQGLSVDEENETVREVQIPERFDETWTRYNTLQQSQGFDLQAYHGKRVKVWSYPLTPDTDGRATKSANLMVCDGLLIAGDVADTALDGTMERIMRSTK